MRRQARRTSQGLRTPRQRGDIPPEAICGDCGHRRDEHAEFLPAPCKQGFPPELLHPPTITAARLDAIDARPGCRCLGWTPGAPPPPA